MTTSNGNGHGRRRVAIYARVSTADQTPENQLVALRAFAQARGWPAVEFVDHGVSGAKERRPALDALVAAARSRKVDVVACVRLDRLARSTHHLLTLAREFQALGIDLVAIEQSVDTTTRAIGEFERDLIRERVLAGLRRVRAQGRYLGRPRKHLVDAARARQLLADGLSLRGAARRLGVHHSAITRALAGAKPSGNGVGNPA